MKSKFLKLMFASLVLSSFAAADVGTVDQGYQVGLRNGGITVRRVRQRTLDHLGCGGLDIFQDTLLRVTRSVRASGGSGDRFVKGFYQGYRDAVRQGVHEA